MTTFGKVQEFNPDSDSVNAYIERVNVFFTANDIPAKKRVAIFLSVIGGKTYERLRNLVSPKLPQTLKYSELVDVFKQHYEPQPLVIAERFHFHPRNQTTGESISEYKAKLRRLSTNCHFCDYLEQALRDRLLCSLHNEGIQCHLLAEAKLTLKRALDLALGMEAAERNAKSLKGTEQVVHKLGASHPAPSSRCYQCGRENQEAKYCRFRDALAIYAKIRAISCQPADLRHRRNQLADPREDQLKSNTNNGRSMYRLMMKNPRRAIQKNFHYSPLANKHRARSALNSLVDGKSLRLEIYTGAAVSIISESQQKVLFPDTTVQTSSIKLKTYTG